MRNRLSFSTLGCPEWDLETIVKKALEYGYGGVELRVQGQKHIDAMMDAGGCAAVREIFHRHGIAIAALAGYTAFNSCEDATLAKNRERLMANIGLGVDLGCPTVRTFIGDVPQGMSRDQAIEIAAKNIAPCARAARDAGVTVVVETHDDYCKAEVMHQVFEAMGDCGAKVLWDVQNTFVVGETVEAMTRLFSGRIGHTHFGDCRMLSDGSHELVLMDEGNLPVAQIMKGLDAMGYTGWLSLEWEKMWIPELPEPEIAFPNYAQYMKKRFEVA